MDEIKIPKQLFFIWLGDNKPNYVDFSIDSFKRKNPDFKINFINYTINDIENINKIHKSVYDIDVSNCIEYILDKKNNIYSYYKNQFYNKHRMFCQTLANILRYELINNYGGIYLDCDTFCLRSFDDYILSKKSFCCYTFVTYDNEHRHRDCYFLGKMKDDSYKIRDCYGIFDVIPCTKYHYYENTDWLYKRSLFYDCKLYDYEDGEYYIDHFADRTWKKDINNKIRTPLCKYDNM